MTPEERTLARWQKRILIAEQAAYWAQQDRESMERWAREVIASERRLMARCTFLYAKAKEHGATDEELADQPVIPVVDASVGPKGETP